MWPCCRTCITAAGHCLPIACHSQEYSERQALSLGRSSPIRLDRLANELRDLPVSDLPPGLRLWVPCEFGGLIPFLKYARQVLFCGPA